MDSLQTSIRKKEGRRGTYEINLRLLRKEAGNEQKSTATAFLRLKLA